MTSGGIKMGMTPPHPGTFIRIEALEELGLSVSAAARILGVRRATLSDLVNGNASLSPEMALQSREGVRPQHGPAAADAGMARRESDARPGRRDRRSPVSAGMIATHDNFFDHSLGGAGGT